MSDVLELDPEPLVLSALQLSFIVGWGEVLIYAGKLAQRFDVELVQAEVGPALAVVYFRHERDGQSVQIGHALTLDLVRAALSDVVWQHPMERAVEQLVAKSVARSG